MLQGDTKGYRGLHEVTQVYKGLKRVTGETGGY